MSKEKIWCVVPAAGVGRRMGAERPKQYLELCGRMVIEHTLDRLCRHPGIDGISVALSPDDAYWDSVRLASSIQPRRTDGGTERCQSVINGLYDLNAEGARREDWVLVHDAVRPCVRFEDIDRLILESGGHAVGGVLGVPVRDTMKRVGEENLIEDTVNRHRLWHAFTPQMFRLGPLISALEQTVSAGIAVTDEAQAMEHTGAYARMVEGHSDNIKITTRGDLKIAEQYLVAQGKTS